MFKLRVVAAGIGLLSLCSVPVIGQELGNSPYSRFGLGDEAPVGFLRNTGMAGVGVSSAGTVTQQPLGYLRDCCQQPV